MLSALSPVRLAVWLSLPLFLLATLGLWLMRAERARIEVELRREADRWVDFAMQAIGSADLGEKVAGLAVVIPATEAPSIGPEAHELVVARAELKSARGEEAATRLASLLARPGIEAAVSETGLPLRPLAQRLLYEARPSAESAEALASAAVRSPSLLSLALIEDAAGHLPPEQRDSWRRRAVEAREVVHSISRGRPVPGWQVEARADGSAQAFPLAEVSDVVKRSVAPTASLLPAGLGLHVEWSGHPVVPAPGSELATRVRPPWRVAVAVIDPRVVASAAARRGRWLGWMLAAAMAATAFALWVAWRAFRRQAELARAQMEFVASVSHELRTPVASITAMAERLEGGQADAAQTDEYHRFIGREGRRLAALVENVLDFSRLERGKRAFSPEPTDLPALARETAALLRPRAEEKGLSLVEVINDVPEDRWPEVDATALRQALVNLLDNAVKFTPAGGRIELEFAEENGAIVFRVSDTGIGIDPRERSNIFERFYRVDNSLTRETTGAGIGLSLVRHIAEAHGATVNVESEPGRFSRFTLRFPAAVPCASS